ncbi:MAG: hypothetical protein WKG01_23300 [Kofleriaceae bacterium]
MWIILLTLLEVASPKTAQRRLAETLAAADSIDSVVTRDRTVSFAITRAGTAFSVAVTTRKSGEVSSLVVTETPAGRVSEHGGLSWLSAELASGTAAVTRLAVDEDGAVTITTRNGRTYMAIPGRGSGGNAAIEAQWAAAWDRQVH